LLCVRQLIVEVAPSDPINALKIECLSQLVDFFVLEFAYLGWNFRILDSALILVLFKFILNFN
jgi:hypothetical protein